MFKVIWMMVCVCHTVGIDTQTVAHAHTNALQGEVWAASVTGFTGPEVTAAQLSGLF